MATRILKSVLLAFPLLLVLVYLFPRSPRPQDPEVRDAQVRAVVNEFYQNFDEGFLKPATYATDDWYHINPNGGVDRRRDAVLKTVRGAHETFLKGTTDKPISIEIRYASADVAIATVTSEMSPFKSPDGVSHGVERHVRTFVVVHREEGWRIMQDHNTTVVPLP